MQTFSTPAGRSTFLLLLIPLDYVCRAVLVEHSRHKGVKPSDWNLPALVLLVPFRFMPLLSPQPREVDWRIWQSDKQWVGCGTPKSNWRISLLPDRPELRILNLHVGIFGSSAFHKPQIRPRDPASTLTSSSTSPYEPYPSWTILVPAFTRRLITARSATISA